ncbi:serine-rich adhesin for platelets-like isoform X2 [Anopheles aquasalis]|uniref:serine-rich adhesin for platelets-like isoform X2 n=1 Tax=Anopheles aquasalis TaxID=42839 RepID=UPI00215AB974|nr:serine-rich adhesin for platelets-like isoform X2 [Anopheles aquasalis]
MDFDTMTTTAGTKESAAGPILPETATPAVEEAGKVNKNGSPADSTDRLPKEKDSDLPAKGRDAAAAVVKKPPENSATQPSVAAPAGSAQPKKQEEQKSPAKESPSGTADHGTNKPESAAAGVSGSSSSVQELQDDDMENDELSKRLEAMEKGEDLVLEKTDQQTTEKAAGNHQNGLNEREADKPAAAKETDTKSNESVTSATSAATAEAKSANTMLIDDNGSNTATATATDAVTSNAKRKLLSDALGGANEPETKKVHIADVTDSSASSVATNKSSESPQPLPIEKIQSKELAASTSAVPPQADEKPSSVEEMEVDGSPEPETSSSNNVETLPDTEPNTEPESEDKGEEISSSVADQPMKQEEDESTNSNVSSSDDKREGGREGKPKLAESEVSASALAGPSEDEAMDVDEDEGDMAAESSTSAGTTVKPVPVMEPPCIKKSAYLCYDKDQQQPPSQPQQQQTVSEKTAEVKPETGSTISVPVPGGGSSVAASSGGPLVASKEETMEVDSASKAASSVKTGSAGQPAKDEADSSLADDSKKDSATPPDVLSTAKRVDESIVESSQPSSSSDTKKQPSDSKRADDQLRAAVHRSALLAKASSTPTNSGSASAPTSSNPSTPNPPVVASAVSSSNVFSSTPIHANFECKPVTSGNVSKITNPPSSVETSRIEPDDSTELLHSSIAVAASKDEEKETSKATNTSLAASTTSVGKVSDTTPTKTESASSTAATASTSASPSVRQTPPKKDPALKQEPQSPSGGSSSRSSSKTIDSSEVDSCTVVSAMNTTEEINLYKNNAKKFNGISSTSSDVSDLDGPKPTILITSIEKSSHVPVTPTTSKQLNLSEAIEVTTSSEQQYEVSVWYEGQDLQFLSIEKLHCMIKGGHTTAFEGSTSAPAGSAAKPHDDVSCTDSSAAKQSSTATTTSTSNGSVTSLGPFPLPDSKLQASNASSDSSSTSLVTLNSQHGSSAKLSQSGLPKVKQTVTGSIELCDLIINEFRKLKRKLQPEHTENEDDSRIDDSAQQQLSKTPKTPAATGRAQSRKESSVAKKSASRGQKRTKLMQDSEEEDDHEYGDDGGDARTPKAGTSSSVSKQAAKRSKQAIDSPSGSSVSTTKAAPATVLKSPEPKQFDICCLARWTDRKYYAGRVTNQRGDKFVVIFEDGCSKTLSRDIIVFGEDGVLPILNHSIHALTGGDTYEPAIVEEIKRNETSNDVVYCVRTASSTLEIAATDIYLTDEQAKWIHNACKDKPDPIKKLLSGTSAVAESGENSAGSTVTGGGAVHVTKADAAAVTAAIEAENAVADGEKGSRSTRSKRTANDKPMTPGTPEAGYSGGVGKKGRRGRRLS